LLERFVSDAYAWPRGILIEGTAGIGKSTLLEAAVDAATERSIGVLRCNPGDHESRLSFAALRDLLEDAYDETAAKLPAPQRRALAVALLREEPAAPLDRGAVSTAFLTFLRERSRSGRLLVVVDDVQWLDRPTASALTFAIRRLSDEPVGLILTLRSDGSGRVPLGLAERHEREIEDLLLAARAVPHGAVAEHRVPALLARARHAGAPDLR